jgi:hypothetical protein
MELAHPAQTEFVICDYAIENSLHYVRDVTFGEDRSRIRTGNAPQVMAALRNLTITLIHRSGSSQIATSRRHFAFHPRQALDLLLQRRSSQPSFSTLGVRGLHGPFLFARAFCHTPSSEQFIPGLSRNHDSDTGWESSRADEPVKHQQAQTAMNSCKTPVPMLCLNKNTGWRPLINGAMKEGLAVCLVFTHGTCSSFWLVVLVSSSSLLASSCGWDGDRRR